MPKIKIVDVSRFSGTLFYNIAYEKWDGHATTIMANHEFVDGKYILKSTMPVLNDEDGQIVRDLISERIHKDVIKHIHL